MKKSMSVFVFAALVAVPVAADEGEFKVLQNEVVRPTVGKTKIGMKQAIETAMQEVANGTLLEAELGVKGETPVFELEFLKETGATEVTVDAVSGKVLGKEDEKPEADEAGEYKQARKALGETKFTLLQAIDAAMNEVKGGTVVEAEAEVEDGKLVFEVEVLAGDQCKEVTLNADGKAMKTEIEKAEGQAWVFDRDEAGKAPTGWKFGFTNAADGKATWTVAKDDKSPTSPNVLTLDAKSGDGTFNLAMADKTSFEDVDVRTRIRANTGKEDQGGGLIWRCKDENNYYVCRMNPLESNFRVYKVVGGKRQQLENVEIKTETGEWYVVRAKMVGNHIMCYVNDKKLLDVTDDAIKDGGMVGLWTKADASSSFDNIAVRTGKLSKHDQEAAKPGETGKKPGKDDNDDDDDEK